MSSQLITLMLLQRPQLENHCPSYGTKGSTTCSLALDPTAAWGAELPVWFPELLFPMDQGWRDPHFVSLLGALSIRTTKELGVERGSRRL